MFVTLYRRKGFFASLLFITISVLTSLLDRHYPLGTAMRMGPGYCPFLLGLPLAGLGLLRVCKFQGEHVGPQPLQSILFIGGGLVLISGLTHWESCRRELDALSMALALYSAAIFHYGLGLPFDLLPI